MLYRGGGKHYIHFIFIIDSYQENGSPSFYILARNLILAHSAVEQESNFYIPAQEPHFSTRTGPLLAQNSNITSIFENRNVTFSSRTRALLFHLEQEPYFHILDQEPYFYILEQEPYFHILEQEPYFFIQNRPPYFYFYISLLSYSTQYRSLIVTILSRTRPLLLYVFQKRNSTFSVRTSEHILEQEPYI